MNTKFVNKLKKMHTGIIFLELFIITILASIVYAVLCMTSVTAWPEWWGIFLIIFLNIVLFWVGIILVYLYSKQLGVKTRVLGIVLGWIPIANVVMLIKILDICNFEYKLEMGKIKLDESRKMDKICETKYPILLVHGVFFRDFKYFNYWGRIPAELEKNGATIFYGNQNSASSVADSGKELADRIRKICIDQGYGKVNIIAHSKGGLDSRMAISMYGCAPYVQSLTTINTPHRGCEFADYLLNKIPQSVQKGLDEMYNAALSKLGDKDPSFLDAVNDLTASSCAQFNSQVFDAPSVYYQSVGSKLNKASGGRFPLNYTNHLVGHFDGPNDGLVGEKSFCWGSDFEFITIKGKRGISHGDVIDLNRENFKGFDVREYFVQLVSNLKKKGF